MLVDDHAVIRAGLKSLLSREPGMEIVGDTGDGRQAVKLAQQLTPDIVVMDIGMPELNGIEAAHQITTAQVKTKVVFLSMHREKSFVDGALRAGASGYVLKDDAPKVLAEAIRMVAGGGTYISPAVASDIFRSYAQGQAVASKGVFADLSGRELEVLQLVAEGKSTKEIAAKLHVSAKTVAAHREHIMAKLNLHSAVDLVRYALRQGLCQL